MKNHINEDVKNKWLFVHGHSISSKGKSSTYKTWLAMHCRCKDNSNKNYGGIGISVCERWNDFDLFLQDMGERPKGKTIDRIDPSKNYEPENCRWATTSEQSKNRRNSVKTKINGRILNLSDVSKIYDVPETTIFRRFHQGLRGEDLIEKCNRNKYNVGDRRKSKLNWDSVREIRRLLNSGYSQSSISKMFSVSQSVVSEINSNKTWKIEFDPRRHYSLVPHDFYD